MVSSSHDIALRAIPVPCVSPGRQRFLETPLNLILILGFSYVTVPSPGVVMNDSDSCHCTTKLGWFGVLK